MPDLEDMLRRGSREPQPDGPPPGGFAELQRRMVGSPPPNALPVYLGVPLLLVVLGLACWWLIAPADRPVDDGPLPPPPAAFPAASPPVAADAASPYVPAAARPGTDKTRFAGSEALPQTGDASAPPGKVTPKSATPPALPPVHSTDVASAPPSNVDRLPATSILPLFREPVIVPPAVTVPETRKSRPAGQWDIRLNVYPNPAKRDAYLEYYADEPPVSSSYGTNAFVMDGKLRLLYWAGTVRGIDRYFQPIGQLQVARHTTGGLTYGLGATYFQQGVYPVKSILRQLGDVPGRYVAYNGVDFKMWLLAANVGYAFATGSRWKPWLHGGLQMALRSVQVEERRLLGVETANTWVQESTTTLAYPAFGSETWVVPNLEVGVHYRLSGHWLVGLSLGAAPGDYADIQPTLGADVRFRW